MHPHDPGQPDGVIRITHDEAMSSHVDDLLNRQKSMRGEGGIGGDRRRSWYYQNWFVFLLAGSFAAFMAWALLEPYFDDLSHLQGKIQRLDVHRRMPRQLNVGGFVFDLPLDARGWVEIRGQKIWLLENAREQSDDGTWAPLKRNKLAEGQEVRVYVEHAPLTSPKGTQVGNLILGQFVDHDPPPPPPGKAGETLQQQQNRNSMVSLLLFGVVGGFIGLGIGAVDGLVCRLLRRALLAGGVGLLVGFVGGFLSGILANLVYAPLNQLALAQSSGQAGSLSPFGFFIQLMGRSLAWGLAGLTMGLGQGLALRSKRLFLYGLLGGVVGGLLGGMLFDPVDIIILGMNKPSSHWSRVIGIVCVGGTVGLMIGLVELLARDAWLRMTAGPLAGKEFLVFKDVMKIGSSPRSDIYLFNDPDVAPHHATLRALGNDCEIENFCLDEPVRINDVPRERARLRHGDVITLGKTIFVFQQRKA